ncbi:MAG: hypothetical protein AMXMBFR44_0300 [Candidatus Campbellbacteria bacterium]
MMLPKQGKNMRQLTLYAAISLCAALIGVYVFVTMKTQRLYEQITTIQEELLLQIQLERRVRDTAGTLAELSHERLLATTYFKTPEDVITIIEEIEGFSEVVGAPVTVLQVHVDEENPETREGTLVVNVFSEGSWASVSHLLSLLDSLPYQSSVKQVTLDTSGTDSETPRPVWSLRAALSITLKK